VASCLPPLCSLRKGRIVEGRVGGIWVTRKKKCNSMALCIFNEFDVSGGPVGKKRIDKQHSFQSRTQEFNLRELRAASKNFSEKIGEGGFGPVYYGKLANGQEVAIKVSNGISKQGQSEFFTEVL